MTDAAFGFKPQFKQSDTVILSPIALTHNYCRLCLADIASEGSLRVEVELSYKGIPGIPEAVVSDGRQFSCIR